MARVSQWWEWECDVLSSRIRESILGAVSSAPLRGTCGRPVGLRPAPIAPEFSAGFLGFPTASTGAYLRIAFSHTGKGASRSSISRTRHTEIPQSQSLHVLIQLNPVFAATPRYESPERANPQARPNSPKLTAFRLLPERLTEKVLTRETNY